MIDIIDHIVLTVHDIDASMASFKRVLQMEEQVFAGESQVLRFGDQKINLRTHCQETRNHACIGLGDLCVLSRWPPSQLAAHLRTENVTIVKGPVVESGALGAIASVYFNDPDGNLIEVPSYAKTNPPNPAI